MSVVLAAIALHVAMGATWTLATIAVAITRSARRAWLRSMLVVALLNMLAGIYLWHALHRGTWGAAEHLLAVGTFCAFVALGLQVPVAFTLARDARRLEGPPLAIIRVTAGILIATAAAMIGSRWA